MAVLTQGKTSTCQAPRKGEGSMKSARMLIGGKWVDAESAETFAAINPATEEEVARLPQAGVFLLGI